MRGIPMLFTTHIDIAAFAENEQGQSGEHNETRCNFPHTISFKKMGSTREPFQKHPDL